MKVLLYAAFRRDRLEFRLGIATGSSFLAVIATGSHPFPYRTRQLSPSAPMVVGPQGPSRVGRRQNEKAIARVVVLISGLFAFSTRPIAARVSAVGSGSWRGAWGWRLTILSQLRGIAGSGAGAPNRQISNAEGQKTVRVRSGLHA